jgi:hypothetical protein
MGAKGSVLSALDEKLWRKEMVYMTGGKGKTALRTALDQAT